MREAYLCNVKIDETYLILTLLRYLTMPINYSVCVLKNPIKPEESPKAYAKAQISSVMNLKMLSRRVADQSTCSRADVEAVVVSTMEKIVEALREGYQVQLGELGKFRVQLKSEGASTIGDFNSDYIKKANVRFAPGEDLKNIFTGMVFVNVPTRAAVRELLKQQKAGAGATGKE